MLASNADADLAGKIVILSLGGTIAMMPDAAAGALPRLDASDLVKAVPALSIFDIAAVSFRQKPGAHLTFDDIENLAERIEQACASGATGVVVTQGTDTIEEVAFALDLLLDLPQPVVVTGAMRNPSLSGADGPANLLSAVQVASSPAVRALGVVVVFNDEIHAARFVTKRHTTNVSAFVSPNAGQLGWVSEGDVVVTLSLPKTGKILRVRDVRTVRAPIVTLSLDHDVESLSAIVESGVDALVVQAVGGGHCAPDIADVLATLAREKPVILASRAGAGTVLHKTYGFTGSEMDLLGRGLIQGGWLDAAKLRVLVVVALRHSLPAVCLGALLSAFGG